MEDRFEEFWKVKPNRLGGNPKFMAKKKWDELMRSKIDPEKIISAARKWFAFETENKRIGSELVPMAKTWLHQRRFFDYDDTDEKKIDYEAAARAAARLGIEWKH